MQPKIESLEIQGSLVDSRTWKNANKRQRKDVQSFLLLIMVVLYALICTWSRAAYESIQFDSHFENEIRQAFVILCLRDGSVFKKCIQKSLLPFKQFFFSCLPACGRNCIRFGFADQSWRQSRNVLSISMVLLRQSLNWSSVILSSLGWDVSLRYSFV